VQEDYQAAIARLLKRITASNPGDSAKAIRDLCEGVSILEQAKLYAAAQSVSVAMVSPDDMDDGHGGLPN
jgi:hypothetical protein